MATKGSCRVAFSRGGAAAHLPRILAEMTIRPGDGSLGSQNMTSPFPRAFGRYTLIQNLAQGGMGALYLACHGEPGLERACVIKTVLPQLADKEYVARFRDEA